MEPWARHQRRISVRRLEHADDLLDAFLGEVAGLGRKLGGLLVQLPPGLELDLDVAERFFAALARRHTGNVYLEPRHKTWFGQDAARLMQDFRVSRVAADPPVVPDAAEPGGSLDKVYFRLHGSPQVYYSAYANEYLDDLAIRLRAYAEAGVPTWCIFDNTARGEAIRNALQLTLKIAPPEKTSAIGGEEFRRGLGRDGRTSEGEAPRIEIRTFEEKDETEVIALWGRCGLLRPWNDPRKDIARKLHIQRDLFLVGTLDGTIVGSVMGGYEGHRGWVNYLAVEPSHRRRGIGRTLMKEIELRLSALGCPKVNLQMRAENEEAIQFYERIGFAKDPVLSMGKRLEHDWP